MSGLNGMLQNLFEELLGLSTNISELLISAILIVVWVLIGIISIKIVRGVIYKSMKANKDNARALTIAKLLSSVFKYLIWIIVVLMIFGVLNIDITPFIALTGVIGLAVGFGAQEIVRDFITGFFIIFEDSFAVGDVVEVDGFKGNVLSLGLRTTVVENWRGDRKIINNGKIDSIINFSRNNSIGIIEFGVSYDTDLNKFADLMDQFVKDSFDKYDDIIEQPKFLGVTALADSSINMMIIAKTKPMNYFQVERDLRKDLVILCNHNNIKIPYPQLVIHNE